MPSTAQALEIGAKFKRALLFSRGRPLPVTSCVTLSQWRTWHSATSRRRSAHKQRHTDFSQPATRCQCLPRLAFSVPARRPSCTRPRPRRRRRRPPRAPLPPARPLAMPFNDFIRQRMQPLTSAFTANRIFLYAVFSTFATLATIGNACRIHSNFYSVSVYLSRSGRSLLVSCHSPRVVSARRNPSPGSCQLRLPPRPAVRPHSPADILWSPPTTRSRGESRVSASIESSTHNASTLSGCMTRRGCSSLNHCWRLQSFGTSLTYHSLSCSASSYSSSVSIGSWRTVWNL